MSEQDEEVKIRVTQRLARELREITKQDELCPKEVRLSHWYAVWRMMDHERETDSRIIVNLSREEAPIVKALWLALRYVEDNVTHVQVYQSAHARAEEVASFLGISAIDRLGRIVIPRAS
jgi:hypothetical protein